jgi:hypothetical protein
MFHVTGNTDVHNKCYTKGDGPYKDYYFHSLSLEFL